MPADGSNIIPLTPTERVISRIPRTFSALEKAAFLTVADDTPEHVRRVAKREVARAHAARRDFEARRGVRMSGFDPDPYAVRSIAEIAAEAEAEQARMSTPRARFCEALNGVEEIDPVRADKIRKEFNRSLADDRLPLNTASVGACLTLLNAVPGKSAREGIDILAELLIGEAA